MRWFAITLLGLLGLSYALIALSATSTQVRPSPDDTGLGGLSILAETLKREGFRVAYDRSTRPRLQKDEVAIAPVLESHEIPKAALAHVTAGGRAFVIGVPKELQPVGDSLVFVDTTGRKIKADSTTISAANPMEPEGQIASTTAWKDQVEEDTVATLAQVGAGRIASLDVGALATNRFLGRLENAKIVLSMLRLVAKPGDQLVFLAGGYGEAESPGPIEAIGPWAVGALWQSLIVLAAFGVARGIRFGLSAPEITSRRGARELLDAMAGYYRRGKRTDAPLAVARREHPDLPEALALAARTKVPEEEARKALLEFEARSRRRKS